MYVLYSLCIILLIRVFSLCYFSEFIYVYVGCLILYNNCRLLILRLNAILCGKKCCRRDLSSVDIFTFRLATYRKMQRRLAVICSMHDICRSTVIYCGVHCLNDLTSEAKRLMTTGNCFSGTSDNAFIAVFEYAFI